MRELAFDDLQLFARVADLGTLSAVARERDVPVSQVSRTLARIEKSCGARLLHRSTHGLSLTAEGETLLASARRMLGALDELEGEFAASHGEPSGVVRVAASTVIAHYLLTPGLPGLAERHPRLRIELEVGDRLLDMAREGIDLAIRTGSVLPDTAVARRIGTHGRALYAAPAYVDRHGLPETVAQLRDHALVTNTAVPALNLWPFRVQGKALQHPADGRWRTNDTNMVARLVLEGLGIGRLASIVGDELVRQGRLVPVLPALVDPEPVPLYAVTAGARHRLPKIRACIAWWEEWLAQRQQPEPRRA